MAAILLAVPFVVGSCGDLQSDETDLGGAVIVTSSSTITQTYSNPNGSHQTISTAALPANPNASQPFFQDLGTNGRRCDSCHVPAQSWGITPIEVQQRFNATQGTDPIFRTNDGSNAPNLPVGTVAQKQAAYSLLLNRGTIRVGIGIPATAEFNLTLVEDPYHFASATELSLFRRPLPSTNLKFLSAVMWDGREVAADGSASISGALAHQSNDATLGHAQAAVPLTTDQQNSIVAFESALFTAQITDNAAGSLTAAGAQGGPTVLSNQQFFIGINDPLGGNPQGTPFSTHVFSIYDAWATSGHTAAQASIARGEALFNNRVFHIVGVRGVNDAVGITDISAGCTLCHDSPNVGNHSVKLPLDLGLTDPNTFNTDTTPRYTLVNKTTGATIRTSDPGRALIDGKWAHVATFKGPILRGLASRRPYFHNGFASTLGDVVHFYDTRFHIGFTTQETIDLTNFLQSL